MTQDEIQKLKALALAAEAASDRPGTSLTSEFMAFIDEATPTAVLSLIAQLEARPAVRDTDEADADAYTIERMGQMLARIAIAMKGPELPLHRHGYHDLPELVEKAMIELAIYRAAPPSIAVEAVSEQSDAGALEIACIINKKLGEVISGRMYLLPDDLAALKRFYECATDFDSGGHDVPKAAMVRLCEIGVCRHLGFGNHTTTSFGDYVLERDEGEPAKLPLKTLVERNADAAIAAKGN